MSKQKTKEQRHRRWVPPVKKKYIQNSLELQYEREVLQPALIEGEILTYSYESVRFRLADNTTYTPDYFVVYPDRIEFHEVKGYWTDKSRVKWKVAGELYPWFVWRAVQRKSKQWRFETYGARTGEEPSYG